MQRSFVQRSETPRDNPPGLRATLWLGSPGFCATLWDGQSTRPAIVHCFETVARSVVNNARDNQSGTINKREALWNGRQTFMQRSEQVRGDPRGLRATLWDGRQAFEQRPEPV